MRRPRVILYLRCSTVKQVDEGYSLEMQLGCLEEYCKKNNFSIRGQYEDKGISGGSREDRPQLEAALAALKKGYILMVYSISRMSRSIFDTCDIVREIKKKDAFLLSVTDNIDTRNDDSENMLMVMGVCANMELKHIRHRVKNGLAIRKQKYGSTNDKARYGFSCDKGVITEIPHEQAIIARIKELHNTHWGRKYNMPFLQIARHLNDEGLKPRRGQTWSGNSVRNVLIAEGIVRKVKRSTDKEKDVSDSESLSSSSSEDNEDN